MADDRYSVDTGMFAVAKHFDVLSNPRKLQPKRGMTGHTADTGIGNLIVANNGAMYGSGLTVGGSPATNGKLWKLAGYGVGDAFEALSTNQLSGATAEPDFLVDWPDAGNIRTIQWASANLLVCSDPAGGSAAATDSLTFSSIGQGFVHPKDKYLYFPYRTSTTPYIGLLAPNATPFGSKNYTAFTLPLQYRAYCLTNYGNFLAIPLTGVTATSLVNSSMLALWDRDTTNTQFSETYHWGQGVLKVLNNIGGVLIGVSELGSASLQAGTAQDYNAIQIKVWDGGVEPTLVKEIKAVALSGASGQPSVTLNARVNFVQNNRLYFSAIVNPNDGIQPSRIGLYSVGRNKTTGEWTVNLEHMATTGGTETTILAAAIVGDYVEMVYNAAGTLAKSINGNASSTTYGSTSIFESGINPGMEPLDRVMLKSLYNISVHFEPLPSGATVALKYRVDSKGADSDWVTVATASADDSVAIEMPQTSSTQYKDGRNYEFRLESFGGAVITGLTYRYDVKQSKIA